MTRIGYFITASLLGMGLACHAQTAEAAGAMTSSAQAAAVERAAAALKHEGGAPVENVYYKRGWRHDYDGWGYGRCCYGRYGYGYGDGYYRRYHDYGYDAWGGRRSYHRHHYYDGWGYGGGYYRHHRGYW